MTTKENKIIEISIQQNLLLWQLTNSMISIDQKIKNSLSSTESVLKENTKK
jgi:hypothetical protein